MSMERARRAGADSRDANVAQMKVKGCRLADERAWFSLSRAVLPLPLAGEGWGEGRAEWSLEPSLPSPTLSRGAGEGKRQSRERSLESGELFEPAQKLRPVVLMRAYDL